ncbi:hypothetical protein BDV93DRAFT_608918 [Ceratobasidium sp. AG-I]|nr:hypothetical protein BDV93DRAFT_608918 [Ceratobasidium sp. AG-I]
MRPSQRVFQVPELVALICSFSTVSDCARLLCTNRTLSKVAIAPVWRHVDGVRHLLGLISTCVMSFRPPLNAPVHIGLDARAGKADPFSRYDLYAPHVRSLNIYGSQREEFKVSGWSLLINRAQQKSLLPNLRSLIIESPAKSYVGRSYPNNQLMWTLAFTSPALVILSVPPTTASILPAISYRMASAILKSVTQYCTGLQELSLFPDSMLGRHQDDGENSLLMFISGDPFYQYLVGANQLRHLSGTMAWLRPEPLLVLGKLPLLESITIYSDLDAPSWGKDLPVPENSFPSLRRFSMHEVNPYDALTILRTSHMLRHVTFLGLSLSTNQFERGSIESWITQTLFPVLSNISCLRDLSLSMIPLEGKEPFTLITPSLLDVFSTLPLRSVTLGAMKFAFTSWSYDLGMAWPLVTKLCIPDQALSLDSLHFFATLPKLEYLEINLNAEWISTPSSPNPNPNPGPRSPLHTIVSTSHHALNNDFSDANDTARWLLSYWPNLSRVVCPHSDTTDESVDVLNAEFLGLLSSLLSELRPPEHTTD